VAGGYLYVMVTQCCVSLLCRCLPGCECRLPSIILSELEERDSILELEGLVCEFFSGG